MTPPAIGPALELEFGNRFSARKRTRIEWTFYGVAEHTTDVTVALEATYNLTQDWSDKYVGVAKCKSYCFGVSTGLLSLSEKEMQATEDQVPQHEAKALATKIREEDLEEKQRMNKLQTPSTTPVPEIKTEDNTIASEDDVDVNQYISPDDSEGYRDTTGHLPCVALRPTQSNKGVANFKETNLDTPVVVNTRGDFKTELHQFIKVKLSASKIYQKLRSTQQESSGLDATEETVEWTSMRQLTLSREMSQDIEEHLLIDNNIKVGKRRKQKRKIKYRDAWREGWRDSKKIEVKAARIEPKTDHGNDEMDVED
ncbi:MAG: hypothetical protein Q9201_000694 [Fulgogasparrea decipioides]